MGGEQDLAFPYSYRLYSGTEKKTGYFPTPICYIGVEKKIRSCFFPYL